MEACALLGVWCSKHKDPSLELACRPPDTQYGLSLRLTSQAGAGLRVGLGCLWEGGWVKCQQEQPSPLDFLGR